MSYRFRVSGVVREAGSGRPLLDLVVRAFDEDVLVDDLLGECRTDADGRFAIVFTQAQFRGVVESRPDLYLVVLDSAAERVLATTRGAVRANARDDERYVIEIPAVV